MTRITATKLARAKFRVGSKTIIGYEPPTPRNEVSHPNHPELTVLASPGQRVNFGRVAYKTGLTLKHR
jgi:hypothetical protein